MRTETSPFKQAVMKQISMCSQKPLVPKRRNVLDSGKEKELFALEQPIVLLGEDTIKIIIIKYL